MSDPGCTDLIRLLINKGAGIIKCLRRRLDFSQPDLRLFFFTCLAGALSLRRKRNDYRISNDKLQQIQGSPHTVYLSDSFASRLERANCAVLYMVGVLCCCACCFSSFFGSCCFLLSL